MGESDTHDVKPSAPLKDEARPEKPVPLRIDSYGRNEGSIVSGEPAAPDAQLDTPNTPDAIAPGHHEHVITAADYIADRKASENDAKEDPGEPESSA